MSSLNINNFIKQIEEKSMDSLEQIYDIYNIAQEKKQFIENNKLSKESILTLVLENLNVKINYQCESNESNEINEIKEKPEVKKKVSKIIKKKSMIPSNFTSEYHYFIYMCSKLSLEYYRFELTNWCGPAIIISKDSNSFNIKKKIKIDLNIDYLSNDTNLMAIYPKRKYDPNIINYTNYFSLDKDSSITNIDVVEWEYNNTKYLLDKINNNVYNNDVENNTIIGKRIYDTTNNTWSIKNLYK